MEIRSCPAKKGHKGITSGVVSSAYVNLFGYGESTVELCVCGIGQNELHRNKGMILNSNISWIQSPFWLPAVQPRSSFITKHETKDHCTKAQRQYHMTFLALKLVLLARELKQLCCYFTYSSGTNMFFSFGRKELQLLYWRLLMFKEEHLHGSEGLYGITWRRSMVLVLLFLTCLCVLVCQRLA